MKMYTIHEGEILLKEKYGSTSQERFYVNPPEQRSIVILDNEKFNDIGGWFTKVFLPQGYPDSVSKDYLSYQIWDTAQAFCSTITGTIATQEVLRGVGVGDTGSTPLAATITWVLKDGCGHIGKILFAYTHGTYLDAYSKKWRLYADTLNDAAVCIEIALPLFKNYTTFALCVSTVMKAIVGVAGGATRAAMTQHHAVRGNMADVSAKDSAQETAVNLIASIAALMIITIFGSSIILFILMMILHIVFNYFAVRAVCLRTLNEPRFLQVINVYLKEEVMSNPCEVNKNEPIIFYQLGPNLLDLKLCGFRIRMGYSIKKMISRNVNAEYLRNLIEIYLNKKYMLVPNISDRNMYVLIRDDAKPDDILCAYFHAVLLSTIICSINDCPLAVYENSIDTRPFALVCRTLQSAEWTRETTHDIDSFSGFTYEPSKELAIYVDKIVQTEWRRVKCGLLQVGWDLNKHLLMIDEWRISSMQLVTEDPVENIDVIKNASSKNISFGGVIDNLDCEEIIDRTNFTIEPDVPSETNLSETDVKELSKSRQSEKSQNSAKLTEIENRRSTKYNTKKSELSKIEGYKNDNKDGKSGVSKKQD